MRSLDLLGQVQIPNPERVARLYPHELSGGMAQRVVIARALAGEPKLLIADEPTTALDVTVQAEILELLRELKARRGMAVLLVTHDWGVVADSCDRAVVMYAGQVVERAAIEPLFREPLHPYSEALLASNPQNFEVGERLTSIPGTVPQPGSWPGGCHFHPRCRYATATCRDEAVELEQVGDARLSRCIHSELLRIRP
jgi:peptide/nickel transport system permease protein